MADGLWQRLAGGVWGVERRVGGGEWFRARLCGQEFVESIESDGCMDHFAGQGGAPQRGGTLKQQLFIGIVVNVVTTGLLAGIAFTRASVIEALGLVDRSSLDQALSRVRTESTADIGSVRSEVASLRQMHNQRLGDAVDDLTRLVKSVQSQDAEETEVLRAQIRSLFGLNDGSSAVFRALAVTYSEAHSSKEAVGSLTVTRDLVVIVSAFANAATTSKRKDVALSLDLSVGGNLCARDERSSDGERDRELALSVTCVLALQPRTEPYQLQATTAGTNVVYSNVAMRFVTLDRFEPGAGQ